MDGRKVQSQPLHVQKLERLLELGPFITQLETLLASPIRIPASSLAPLRGSTAQRPPHSVFSVKGIWADDEERKSAVSSLYNFKTIKKRKWLKNILLEESDSDSDNEQAMSEDDLKILLKVHRCRRKYQKKYHSDILNSQYTYYGAGLLSEEDGFPEHQKYVLDLYGFGSMPPLTTLPTVESAYEADSQTLDCPESSRGPSIHSKTQPSIPCYGNQHMTDIEQANLWREIATEEIPKAFDEKYIAKTYKRIVAKNLAVWCSNYVEQSGQKVKKGSKKSSQEKKE